MAAPTCTFTGNLCADPELGTTKTGKTYATFTLAYTPRQRQNDGTWQDKGTTTFMRITAWEWRADQIINNNLQKGARLTVTGHLRTSEWISEQGEKRSRIEMIAEEVSIPLPTNQPQNQSQWGQPQNQTQWGQTPNNAASVVNNPIPPAHTNGPLDDPWATNNAAPPF